MKILVLDDEIYALQSLKNAVLAAAAGAELAAFSLPSAAIEAVRSGGFQPDVAFLDVELPGMTGLTLAGILKKLRPEINIVFVTAYSAYAMDALALRPSGYVIKPATREKILAELENLRHPPERQAESKRVYVRCFGYFEVFVAGQPLRFIRAKSRELLAYLIDRRGGSCTPAQIAEALWEDGVYDRSRQKQLSVIRADLLKSLRQAGIAQILRSFPGSLSVDPDAFDCDYYQALAGDAAAMNGFAGQYMAPYAWAEFTTGRLTFIHENSR